MTWKFGKEFQIAIVEGKKLFPNSILEISCNILYDYANYDHIRFIKKTLNTYSLLTDANNSLIQSS